VAARLPENVDAVRNMGREELQVLFAAAYVDEIAAALKGNSRQLLRERLARLSDDDRREDCSGWQLTATCGERSTTIATVCSARARIAGSRLCVNASTSRAGAPC
jgi:hypothetical protein